MKFKNSGKESLYFRDDAGKHEVKAGDEFEVVGDQHLAYVRSLDGVKPADAEAKEAAKADEPQAVEGEVEATTRKAKVTVAE